MSDKNIKKIQVHLEPFAKLAVVVMLSQYSLPDVAYCFNSTQRAFHCIIFHFLIMFLSVSISDKLNFLRFWAGICATRGFPAVVWRFACCKYGAIHPRQALFYRPQPSEKSWDKCARALDGAKELAKGFCICVSCRSTQRHKTQGETRF